MTKPSFTPSLSWVANAAGQMTGEAQRILRKLIDITFNRTGLETSAVVTGTAGATNELAKWNADGDLVTVGNAAAARTLIDAHQTNAALGPYFFAQSTAGTTLAANGFTKLEFNSEIVDSAGCYDPATNYRFTPNVAGTYHVFLSYALAGVPTVSALFAADIYKNGARFQQGIKFVTTSETATTLDVVAMVAMNGSTDYLEAFGYNGQAANTRTIDANSFSNAFGAHRIGA